jgi:putative hydrolase of the HAD superfamily
MAASASRFDAVVFDLGGVVMPSPLDVFRAYEASAGLPHRFLSEVVLAGGDGGAWSRLERGELTMSEFTDEFEAECARAGCTVDVAKLFEQVHAGSAPHDVMLTAIRCVRAEGLKAGALTNNWRNADVSGTRPPDASGLLDGIFDVVIESAVEGLRKPDPRIYELVCSRLDVAPSATVFLDDLGVNLKPARAMGMATIKVTDPVAAVADLEAVLGLSLTEER